MTELLPCPFCGDDAVLQKGATNLPGHHAQYVPYCGGCGIGDVWFDGQDPDNNKARAVKFWNTRTVTTYDAKIDALVKALEPFAAFADPRNKIPPDTILTAGSAMARKQITMANCYAARDALHAVVGGARNG